MSVALEVHGYAYAGHGNISVEVTLENDTAKPLSSSRGAYTFFLFKPSGELDHDFDGRQSGRNDVTPVQSGASLTTPFRFMTGPVEPGSTYMLRCVHGETKDSVDEHLVFQEVFLGQDKPR